MVVQVYVVGFIIISGGYIENYFTKKKIFFIVIFLVCVACNSKIILANSFNCSAKANCTISETCLFSMYQENDTHIAECNYFDYDFCCSNISSSIIKDSCYSNETALLKLFQNNNSHADLPNETGFSKYLCIEPKLNCTIKGSCNSNESALFSMYSNANSHIGLDGYFNNTLCCENPSANITVPPYTGTGPSGGGVSYKEFNFTVNKNVIEIVSNYPYTNIEDSFIIKNNENFTMYPQFYFSCKVNKSLIYLDENLNTSCISDYCTINERKIIGPQSYNIVGIPPKSNETYKITCKNMFGNPQLSGSIIVKDKYYTNTKEIVVLINAPTSYVVQKVTPESEMFSGMSIAFIKGASDIKDKVWYELNYPIVCFTIRCFDERILYWNLLKQPIDLKIYKIDSINLLLIFIIITIVVVVMSLEHGELPSFKKFIK